MAKCGSCYSKDAELYKKIAPTHKLYPVLTTMNIYHKYKPKNQHFCDECIEIAEEILKGPDSPNDQSVASFTSLENSVDSPMLATVDVDGQSHHSPIGSRSSERSSQSIISEPQVATSPVDVYGQSHHSSNGSKSSDSQSIISEPQVATSPVDVYGQSHHSSNGSKSSDSQSIISEPQVTMSLVVRLNRLREPISNIPKNLLQPINVNNYSRNLAG